MDQVCLKRAISFLVVEGTVLDVGCGDGHMGKLLPDCQEYWGVDPAIESDNPRISKHPAEALPFEQDSFDTVLFCESLEHTREPAMSLAEAYRVLIPTGKLAIAVGMQMWARWSLSDILALVGQYFRVRSHQVAGPGNSMLLVNAEKKVLQKAKPVRMPSTEPAKPGIEQKPLITFIVSAYNRPMRLECALISLHLQTHPHEIIVTDNSDNAKILERNRQTCAKYGARFIATRELGAVHCYESAECGIPFARGEWLSFPSDDGYYVPGFAESLVMTGERNKWDLVFCDIVMDPRTFPTPPRWDVMRTDARSYRIDKNCFAVRRSKFEGFPDKGVIGDGRLIDSLVRRGLRRGKAPGVLVVHN